MDPLRICFIGGLIVHKAVWEVLKRRRTTPEPARRPIPPGVRFVKSVKIVILLGIIVQTLLPDVLPLPGSSGLPRVIGLVLFTLGLLIALTGRFQLGENWLDIEAAGVTERQQLASTGIYRFIRHPIYTGDVLLLIGLELGLNSWLVIAAVALVPIVLFRAVAEERMLKLNLPGYASYCRETKRFIPFVA